VIASRGTRWLIYKEVVLVTLGGYHFIDVLEVLARGNPCTFVCAHREGFMSGIVLITWEK
jgi:hypothetical protein